MSDYSAFKKHISDFERKLKPECEDIFLVHSSFKDIRELVDDLITARDKKIQELETKLKFDKSSTESSKPKKDCPPDKIVNPKTGRCIKKPKEKTHKKPEKPKKSVPQPKKECPPGKIINPNTGRCIKKPKEKTHKKPGKPKKSVSVEKHTPEPEKSMSLSESFDKALEHIRTNGKPGSYRKFLNSIKSKYGITLKYDNHGDDYVAPDLYFMKGKKEGSREEMEKVMKYVIDEAEKSKKPPVSKYHQKQFEKFMKTSKK